MDSQGHERINIAATGAEIDLKYNVARDRDRHCRDEFGSFSAP